MRAVLSLTVLAACGGSQVSAPTLVVRGDRVLESEKLAIPATAPYARLFADDARWEATADVWTGPGAPPRITCEVSEPRGWERARVGFLRCAPERELAIAAGLPRWGLIATADGLWFTEHLTTVSPLPDDPSGALAWAKAEPMRLAAVPAPVVYEAQAPATDTMPALAGRVEAFELGDGVWCTVIENAAGGDAARTVLCLHPQRGVVGGMVAVATQGIVSAALRWGTAPLPPESPPFERGLDDPPHTVTLVDAGKGKRARVALTAAVDSAHPATYTVSARAIADDGAGARTEVEQPTLSLRGTAAVSAIEPSGRFRYTFTVAEATATGPATTPALTAGMATLAGSQWTGAVDPDARVAARAVRVEKPTMTTPAVLGQLVPQLDTFVALPTEPIGVGATWTTRYATKLLDHDVTITARSKLVSRKGAVAVVQSQTSIAPIESPVDGGTARLTATGTITTAYTDGRLFPTRASELHLIATVDPTPGVANPASRSRHELHLRMRLTPQ